MRVGVVGVGYVGLVTAACLADSGTDVICVDSNEEKIRQLREGVIPTSRISGGAGSGSPQTSRMACTRPWSASWLWARPLPRTGRPTCPR